MSLAKAVEDCLGHPLTRDEVINIGKFQEKHGMDDSDPLIVVLSLLYKNDLLIGKLPGALHDAAEKTIALHQQTLREQSTLIAKDLILSVTQNLIQSSKVIWKGSFLSYMITFVGGLIVGIAPSAIMFFLHIKG